jgi:hypothetical protein
MSDVSVPNADRTCSYCFEPVIYCKCLVEDPICLTCYKARTECLCDGEPKQRLNMWD